MLTITSTSESTGVLSVRGLDIKGEKVLLAVWQVTEAIYTLGK